MKSKNIEDVDNLSRINRRVLEKKEEVEDKKTREKTKEEKAEERIEVKKKKV